MPSHPIMMKSTSSVKSYSYTSGLAVMAYSSGLRSDFFLYLKSPRDLVKFNPPSTLPLTILLPAFNILAIS